MPVVLNPVLTKPLALRWSPDGHLMLFCLLTQVDDQKARMELELAQFHSDPTQGIVCQLYCTYD